MKGICKVPPTNGDKRIVTKFAWYPFFTKENEWRWLETVTIEQEFWQDYSNYDAWEHDCWENLRFIND